MIYEFTPNSEVIRVILTEEIVSKLSFLKKEVKHIKTFAFEGDLTFWVNERGNFKISQRQDGLWDVYWGLEFYPNRIKNDLKYLDELSLLYDLLTNKNQSDFSASFGKSANA